MTHSGSRALAVVVPAHDEAARVAATVEAARRLALVDLVVVIDDGSGDATAEVARTAGAVVGRHPRRRGKAAAMETGADLVAQADRDHGRSRPGCCCSSTPTSGRAPPTPPRWPHRSSGGRPT